MMRQVVIEETFDSWRARARELLADGVTPDEIIWSKKDAPGLFQRSEQRAVRQSFSVPKQFFELARFAASFDDPRRWGLLYRVLYRVANEGRHLLEIVSDPDVAELNRMSKAVRRDIHKFHAFVRFRRIECDGEEYYVAWHEPHHWCVELATPFFARRFGTMRFSILTPKGCAHWDLSTLSFSPPAARTSAPNDDEMEEFWLTYYRAIYNPFRLKVGAMKKELPVRHWPTLPEAALIQELIREAR